MCCCSAAQSKPGSAIETASSDGGASSHSGGPGGRQARMWPRKSGYAPFSSSALEAARRRNQDLVNARRSQPGHQGVPSPPPLGNQVFFPPSPPPAGHQMIWSSTSGKPQTGSYVIGPRRLDEPEGSFYQPSVTGPASQHGGVYQQPEGETSVYFPPETSQPTKTHTHTIVVEAAVEPNQPSSLGTPRGKATTSLIYVYQELKLERRPR